MSEKESFIRSILLVDDDPQTLYLGKTILENADFQNVYTIEDSREVLSFLEKEKVSIIVVDLTMPFLSGQELLATITREYPEITVIVMSAADEIDTVVDCMQRGAIDYLLKPVDPTRLISSVRRGFEFCALKHETDNLKKHLLADDLENQSAFSEIVTRSKKMRSIFHYIEAIGLSREPVLITGETGAGKELIARSVHEVSGRQGEFVPVNVAGLDDTMFSDALFGHSKGAFTGADTSRTGFIAKAEGGTLFLDEIGDLQELSQIKLLRLLQEKAYYPLGSDSPIKTNCRVVCATNRNLKRLISERKFRKDFYYRLLAHKIQIPALKERREDIPLLLDTFLAEAGKAMKKKKPVPPPELLTLLSTYHFPGNIRELRAMVFDGVSRHKSGRLSLESFKTIIGEEQVDSENSLSSQEGDVLPLLSGDGRFPTLKEAEQHLIREAMQQAAGNQGIAATLLGISRQALNRRILRQPSLATPFHNNK
ncbi:MAG: sigma-54 dependent transcriptional regulator [Thermodesulfobacteriota bacterium]